MEGNKRDAAIVSINTAFAHVMSARRHVVGERLALAGWHTDNTKAADDLRVAREAIDQALGLLQELAK